MAKELKYRFQNPYNSCEEVYYCAENKRHYILMPATPYSQKLCTCTPFHGYYEADCPVRGGLTYIIHGKEVTTEDDGEIIDYAKKNAYENKEYAFYRVKPEYAGLPNYDWLAGGCMVDKLYDYMAPEHFERVTYKRKDVFFMMGSWYVKDVFGMEDGKTVGDLIEDASQRSVFAYKDNSCQGCIEPYKE